MIVGFGAPLLLASSCVRSASTGIEKPVGSLQDDSRDFVHVPPLEVTPERDEVVREIAAAISSYCVLFENGKVSCWGRNTAEVPFLEGSSVFWSPISEGDDFRLSVLDGGGAFYCAVERLGDIVCWGTTWTANRQSKDFSNVWRVRTKMEKGEVVEKLALGSSHLCALSSLGRVACWGDNDSVQLGDSVTSGRTGVVRFDEAVVPALVGRYVEGIAAGGGHTCVIVKGEGVSCWGDNRSGELGVAGIEKSATPVRVELPEDQFIALSSGHQHTCALSEAGRVTCWGNGLSEAIPAEATAAVEKIVGDGTVEMVQLRIGGGDPVQTVVSKFFQTCLGTSQSFVCFSVNPTRVPREVFWNPSLKVAVGSVTVCAVDGVKVWCWGRNEFGELVGEFVDPDVAVYTRVMPVLPKNSKP